MVTKYIGDPSLFIIACGPTVARTIPTRVVLRETEDRFTTHQQTWYKDGTGTTYSGFDYGNYFGKYDPKAKEKALEDFLSRVKALGMDE